jgi:SAM-dependent methyltransferase
MSTLELAAIWHDVECGAYDADLSLWDEMLDSHESVLDLGCGTGRIALHLGRRGQKVTAVDVDPRVLDALEQRAEARKLPIDCVCADVRELYLHRQFDAVLAPMQLMQLLRGAEERRVALARVRRHMQDGAFFAAAVMNLEGELIGDDYVPPPPDMREIDGWLYSSQSVALFPIDHGRAIAIDRIRTAVTPEGEQRRSTARVRLEMLDPDVLEAEMEKAGLELQERRIIPATDEYVGSVVVVATAPR